MGMPAPPPIPGVPPVAEPGQTTTEFIGKTVVEVIVTLLGLATAFGHGLSVAQQTAILATAGMLVTALEGAYAVSRGLRKQGTNG